MLGSVSTSLAAGLIGVVAVAPIVAPRHPAAQTSAAAGQRIPEWRRGAMCYEVFVRSFYDSDGDGVGDLKGLTEKLDYINDGDPNSTKSLGARCVWLMPVAESPSYHGYDVSNYYRVTRDYGTNADFKTFVAAAHRRGIRVLVDLVLNHASSRHPYFVAAMTDTTSPYRGWFRWSPTKPDQKSVVLNAPQIVDKLDALKSGISDSGVNLTQDRLGDLEVPVPDLDAQQIVVDVVEDQLSVVAHVEADLDAKLRAAQSLRQSILRHAFTGQLVPQDANDEPASALLARIAAEREARDAAPRTAKAPRPRAAAGGHRRPFRWAYDRPLLPRHRHALHRAAARRDRRDARP